MPTRGITPTGNSRRGITIPKQLLQLRSRDVNGNIAVS